MEPVGDRWRLRLASLLSVLVHALVLLWPHAHQTSEISQGWMTVSFRRISAPPVVESVAVVPQEMADVVLLAPDATAKLKRPKQEPEILPERLANKSKGREPASEMATDSPLQKAAPSPGFQNRPPRRPGEASVLMMVDGSGRPGQIFWDRLPALTDEQLRLIEARIRDYRYDPANRNRAVSETINVFDILRGAPPIPPHEPPAENPVPTQ